WCRDAVVRSAQHSSVTWASPRAGGPAKSPHAPHPPRVLRPRRCRPPVPPAILIEELPLSETGATTVTRGRAEVARVLRGEDDRLVVVVGPCSVHDPAAGLDYAQRLRKLADEVAGDLCLCIPLYFQKPPT